MIRRDAAKAQSPGDPGISFGYKMPEAALEA